MYSNVPADIKNEFEELKKRDDDLRNKIYSQIYKIVDSYEFQEMIIRHREGLDDINRIYVMNRILHFETLSLGGINNINCQYTENDLRTCQLMRILDDCIRVYKKDFNI